MGPRHLTWGFAITVALVIAGLAAADKALQHLEMIDLAASAQRAYDAGVAFLDEGRYTDAVASLRSAHATERGNRDYALELIVALMDSGKNAEAGELTRDALEEAPNDGRANLIAARLANEEGRPADAVAYYHRAIYGEWPKDATEHRLAVRMELIGFLRAKGNRQELLGELISLEADAPRDKTMQMTLGHLLLAAGSPARAADLYRSVVAEDPKNSTAQAGLGEAMLELGRYREAHQAFEQAFFHAPGNADIRSKLQLINTLISLDPTPRELSSAEKYRRSMRILDLARQSFGQCAAASSSEQSQTSLLTAADRMLASRVPAHPANELAEQNLNLAQQLWEARVKSCGGIPQSEDALRLIMEKLAG